VTMVRTRLDGGSGGAGGEISPATASVSGRMIANSYAAAAARDVVPRRIFESRRRRGLTARSPADGPAVVISFKRIDVDEQE